MEGLRKKRGSIRTQFTRQSNALKGYLEDPELQKEDIVNLWEIVEATYAKLTNSNAAIEEFMTEGDKTEEDFNKEYLECEGYQVIYVQIKSRMKCLLKPAPTSVQNPIVTDARKYLPKLELPIFDGELKSWMTWWSRFAKYHNDASMNATDKFEFLVQAVKPGTEAYRIVSMYPITADNYDLAINALKENFGQDDLQLQVYVRELLNLVISNVSNAKKLPISELCTTLESHLRCLEQLQLKNADPQIWLYPLVESSLPETTMRAWQQSPMSSTDGSKLVPPKSRLDLLREFIRKEVKNEQMISLARDGFGSSAKESSKDQGKKADKYKRGKRSSEDEVSTAAGLVSTTVGKGVCIFCEKQGHAVDRCFKAQDMSLEEKEAAIKSKNACFRCLKCGHSKKSCKAAVRCVVCGGDHYVLMCRKLSNSKGDDGKKNSSKEDVVVGEMVQTTVNHTATPSVLLNIAKVKMIGSDGSSTTVRVIGDTASQKSYIVTNAVKRGKLSQIGEESVQNITFGGKLGPLEKLSKFEVPLRPLVTNKATRFIFKLLAKQTICGRIHSVPKGPWLDELKEKGIELSEVGGEASEVEILLGNDYWQNILTGRIIKLDCGLVATETIFGWTLGGRLPSTNLACTTIVSLISTPMEVNQLWDLESIGIRDPLEQKTAKEKEQETIKHFVHNVRRDDDGRYVVALPWNGKEADLPSNYSVAEKRLRSAANKLANQEKWEQYDSVFKSWEAEGLIAVSKDKIKGHFLPHRPVFKDSFTTPVRPVFDASCRINGYPSLNHCLAKGPNLIELIPAMMLRFQEFKVGVSADIRKAFQMIKVREEDLPFQKFLWYKDRTCKEVKIYQHDRVVFGINSSPYLLGATINYHLTHHEDPVASTLINKFYVDNLGSSVPSHNDYLELRGKATGILADAGMELREWASSSDFQGDKSDSNAAAADMSMLGLIWNRKRDTLRCTISEVDPGETVTKRLMLSTLAKQFDPMGYLSPATLQIKMLLQKTWVQDLGWDEEVDEETKKEFQLWTSTLPMLKDIEIPRHFRVNDDSKMELHVISDASQNAYAAAVYLRSESKGEVKVQLLLAKTRLAPLEKKKKRSDGKPMIPRLELMGCSIGVRLLNIVREALGYEDIPTRFWTDSSVALAWIQIDGDWAVFVHNRVKEILRTTQRNQWGHISGVENPADLPSRGCTPNQLLQSKWWEGPEWLYKTEDEWPSTVPYFTLPEIDLEKKKISINVAATIDPFEMPRFEHYRKNVTTIGYLLRAFSREKGKDLRLSINELRRAEKVLIKLIQGQAFPEAMDTVGKLKVVRDEDGVLRVMTRLSWRKDSSGFITPILLPGDHPIVTSLIQDFHKMHGHGFLNVIREKLREKYWIVNSRQYVSKVIGNCKICRRHSVQPFDVDPAPLPIKRISDCDPFTTTGVDLAGPLFLKGKIKAWVVLYTCAVYRCVHLDLVSNLSTEAFVGSLERFIAHCGRPNTIFSDNGTNFVGAANLFRQQDWKDIEEKCHLKQIQWVFNPPTAAWWGGWWERLIRMVKDLLKRMLGRAKIDYDQMRTCLAGIGSTINDRPLTIVTETNGDLHPLCPSMFLRPVRVGVFPDVEKAVGLSVRYKVMKDIQRQLQERFRKEYLAMLVMPNNRQKKTPPAVDDVVLIGADNKRRFEWPMGIIRELCPGRDGKTRMAKVETTHGVLYRPFNAYTHWKLPGKPKVTYQMSCQQWWMSRRSSKLVVEESSRSPADMGSGFIL